jgi:uncharacterized membrane protein
MRVTLYYLDGVGDVDQVRQTLAGFQEEIPHELLEIDVSADSALEEEYGSRVPVVEVGPYTLDAPFAEIDLKVALGAARDSLERSDSLSDHAADNEAAPATGSGNTHTGSEDSATSGGKSATSSQTWGMRMNRGVRFFSRHWLAAFSLVIALYAGLPFVAPTLMKVGATGPARIIYTLYSPFCHQFAFRSFFLYGPQAAYPRELAGTDLVPYGEATGLDEEDVIAARQYVGDETVGYKTALCERDVGIYVGILVAGLVYGAIRNRRNVKPLPLRYWFLFGIVPIALDGGTQLISQLGVFPFPARESTPFLRTATGLLFGAMNVWMAYPHVNEAMKETNRTTSAKIAVAEQRSEQLP